MSDPYKTTCPKCQTLKDNCLFSPSALRRGLACINCRKEYYKGWARRSPQDAKYSWSNRQKEAKATFKPGHAFRNIYVNKSTFLGSKNRETE